MIETARNSQSECHTNQCIRSRQNCSTHDYGRNHNTPIKSHTHTTNRTNYTQAQLKPLIDKHMINKPRIQKPTDLVPSSTHQGENQQQPAQKHKAYPVTLMSDSEG